MPFRILSLLLPLLLAGCTTQPSARITAPDLGAVVISSTSDKLADNKPQYPWGSIGFARVDSKWGMLAQNTVLHRVALEHVQSSVYAGTMKPGRYYIRELSGSGGRVTPGRDFGQFDIVPGQVTYLGNLIQLIARDYRSVLLAHPTGPADSREASAIIQEAFPTLSPLLGKPVLGWSSATSLAPPDTAPTPSPPQQRSVADEAMDQRYHYIRQHAVGYLSPLALANGDILFGTVLGTIRQWRGGTMTLLDLGTSHAVAALTELKSGTLLAGGDHAFLKSSTDGGATWKDVPTNLPFGIITDIKELPDGRIHLTLLRRDMLATFAGVVGVPEWTKLAQVNRRTAPIDRDNSLPPRTFVQGSSVVTVTPGNHLLAYDTGAAAMQVLKLPGQVREFAQAPNGWLYCRCAPSFSHVSKDRGQTWERLPMPKNLGMPHFRDERHGVALEHRMYSTHPAKTSDGGATWTSQEVTIIEALRGYLGDGKALLAEGLRGDLYVSPDDGDSWVTIDRGN
jgi:photosystem II stability/assembly factor-like uncharacterized protein